MQILQGVKGIGQVEFDKRDLVRHELVKQIVEAFDKDAERHELERKLIDQKPNK